MARRPRIFVAELLDVEGVADGHPVGPQRLVEMNQQVLSNLDRMISEVEKTVTEDADTTHAS